MSKQDKIILIGAAIFFIAFTIFSHYFPKDCYGDCDRPPEQEMDNPEPPDLTEGEKEWRKNHPVKREASRPRLVPHIR